MTLLELTHGKARRDFGDKCLQRVETKGTKSGQCVAAYDFQGKPMLDSECKNLARESFPEADTVEKILDVDGVPLIEEFSIPLENKVSRFGNRSGDQILAAFNRK